MKESRHVDEVALLRVLVGLENMAQNFTCSAKKQLPN